MLDKDGGKIDYDKLINKFGCQRLDPSLINCIELLTSRSAHVFLHRGVFFAHRYLYLPMLTHSNNICIDGKLEFDGWIFPLFTEISMIYWMDERKRERGKTERWRDLWSGWFEFNFFWFEKSLKYMSGFEIGVSNICLGLNSFVLKFH